MTFDFLYDLIAVEGGNTKPVTERDVALAVLYGTPCMIVLRHQMGVNQTVGPPFVYVYTVHKWVDILKIEKKNS